MEHAKRYQLSHIELVKDKSFLYAKRQILTPEDAFEVGVDLIGRRDREAVLIMALNVKKEIIGVNISSIGTISSSNCSTREILKYALLVNAANIIMMHNHPSGNITESTEDLIFTHKLSEACKYMDVKLLDHIIISDVEYNSLEEHDKLH